MPTVKVPHLRDRLPEVEADKRLQVNEKLHFIGDDEGISAHIVKGGEPVRETVYLRAGPRREIYFAPEEVRAAIVTCGGLSPGLNNVIREIVMSLHFGYGVHSILGIGYGLRGFFDAKIPVKVLTPQTVDHIHHFGGTLLGTSRGGSKTLQIVDGLVRRGINQLYVIGGDGTHRGAQAICEEIAKRGLKIAVAGIPKTIDNDICIIDKSFGFDTAVEAAQEAIDMMHVEAKSAVNGLGIVKLMGRHSGYVAMHAALASREANVCLIPEVPFRLEGPGGLLAYLEARLLDHTHALLVVAEGAGADLLGDTGERDASGNAKLPDIGIWLQRQCLEYFEGRNLEVNIKYLDPGYMIRSIPANAADSLYSSILAQNAVHGAMAGYTGFVSGLVNNHYVYLPIPLVIEKSNRVDPAGRMWQRLLASTGQPDFR